MLRGRLHYLFRHRRAGPGGAAPRGRDGRGGHRRGRGNGERGPGERRRGRHHPGARQGSHRRGGAAAMSEFEALYPFLYADTSDLTAVMDQVRASTVAKANEILELRRTVAERDGARIAECAAAAAARFAAGGRLFAFGNGGSANDTSVVTALCNDIGVEVVFARQLAAFGGRNDIAVGLSTSGNSGNLLRAFDEASRRGMLTVGLAGYDGGKMAELDSIDYLFVVPSSSVHRIQEAQTTTYQVLWELTQEEVSHVPRHTR